MKKRTLAFFDGFWGGSEAKEDATALCRAAPRPPRMTSSLHRELMLQSVEEGGGATSSWFKELGLQRGSPSEESSSQIFGEAAASSSTTSSWFRELRLQRRDEGEPRRSEEGDCDDEQEGKRKRVKGEEEEEEEEDEEDEEEGRPSSMGSSCCSAAAAVCADDKESLEWLGWDL